MWTGLIKEFILALCFELALFSGCMVHINVHWTITLSFNSLMIFFLPAMSRCET